MKNKNPIKIIIMAMILYFFIDELLKLLLAYVFQITFSPFRFNSVIIGMLSIFITTIIVCYYFIKVEKREKIE